MIVRGKAAAAFLHAVNVHVLSCHTARRTSAPPAFSELKLVVCVAQKTPEAVGGWCAGGQLPLTDALLFV